MTVSEAELQLPSLTRLNNYHTQLPPSPTCTLRQILCFWHHMAQTRDPFVRVSLCYSCVSPQPSAKACSVDCCTRLVCKNWGLSAQWVCGLWVLIQYAVKHTVVVFTHPLGML